MRLCVLSDRDGSLCEFTMDKGHGSMNALNISFKLLAGSLQKASETVLSLVYIFLWP